MKTGRKGVLSDTFWATIVATVIGMATFGATPPASASDVTAHDVAEYLNFGEGLYKWDRSPTLRIVEGTSRDQFAILREVMYDINGALPPGTNIKLGKALALPERTWLITKSWYRDNVDRHTLVVAFIPPREWPRFMCRDSGGFTTVGCAQRWWNDGHINQGLVTVDPDHAPRQVRRVLEHELIHALGVGHHVPPSWDSVMTAINRRDGGLSLLDKVALHVLYRCPRVVYWADDVEPCLPDMTLMRAQ